MRRFIAAITVCLVACNSAVAPVTYTPVLPKPDLRQTVIAAIDTPIPATTAAAPTRTPLPRQPPTLEDFWNGDATFALKVANTKLPMGESDTVIMPNGEWWSYVHASDRSAGVKDMCGAAVEFPGCVVIYKSKDAGHSFNLDMPATCIIPCDKCPCSSTEDNIDQQQYPRIFRTGQDWFMVYEYRATSHLSRSKDGVKWSDPARIANTIIWNKWFQPCTPYQLIGKHPFAPSEYDCLAGAPPGVYVEDGIVYVFVATGSNPGSLSCFFGTVDQPPSNYQLCRSNPLIKGAQTYGPADQKGPQTNAFFDFRYLSSADVIKIGARYYMLYEGVRGPGPGDPGDTQFALGLARSITPQIDGKWEKFPGNPILVDLPGNIGLGHADIVVHEGRSTVFTSLDGKVRSRLELVWK